MPLLLAPHDDASVVHPDVMTFMGNEQANNVADNGCLQYWNRWLRRLGQKGAPSKALCLCS